MLKHKWSFTPSLKTMTVIARRVETCSRHTTHHENVKRTTERKAPLFAITKSFPFRPTLYRLLFENGSIIGSRSSSEEAGAFAI
jgi:hypothetical protein